MIERLLVSLRFFAEDDAAADGARRRRAAGDFLDAYRLIVDCPQYELGATARAALDEVAREAERLDADALAGAARSRAFAPARDAARRALVALGADPS